MNFASYNARLSALVSEVTVSGIYSARAASLKESSDARSASSASKVIPLTIRKRNGRPKILPPDNVTAEEDGGRMLM
jgi:hypothetical protein